MVYKSPIIFSFNPVISESFFPFGEDAGDTLADINFPDGSSEPIDLYSAFPFFGGTEDGPIYVR